MVERVINQRFLGWVASGRAHAEQNGLTWDIRLAPDGSASDEDAWDLSVARGAALRPRFRLNDLGYDREVLRIVNTKLMAGVAPLERVALPAHWQDFIKAGVALQAFSARNTLGHVQSHGRTIRVLATCICIFSGAQPWETSADDLRYTIEVAGEAQPSGKLRELVAGFVQSVVDVRMLFDGAPFAHQLATSPRPRPASSPGPVMLDRLSDRNDPEKLPDADTFWELAEIAFTRRPETFSDHLRFAQVRLLYLCGLRIGEVSLVPADCFREKEYLTTDGRPAGAVGGISKSLMLRHFALKQQDATDDSIELVEAYQHVPTLYEQAIRETLDEVRRLTEPMRERLRLQMQAGRQFPEFDRSDLMPVLDAYTRLTGNPVVTVCGSEQLVDQYRESLDPVLLSAIALEQEQALRRGVPVGNNVAVFWSKRRAAAGFPDFRSHDGTGRRTRLPGLQDSFIRVGELEDWLAREVKTKESDTDHFRLVGDRTLPVSELIFLRPKRGLMEGRNDGICDVTRYYSVGRVLTSDLEKVLNGSDGGLFKRYGSSDEARRFSLNPHSLRHSQNNALFSAGVSDAIITKRFNRKNVAQSYVYDHRSLAERLQAVELPKAASLLPENVRVVAKMITSGLTKAPIAEEFRRIQREQGDARAFEFLAAEADGFHATPYGHCINGFTQEPCPKHLQCFGGCNHFVNTGLDQNIRNLRGLAEKLEHSVAAIQRRKGGPGRDNQLRHAQTHLANLRKLLETAEGERPFHDGPDLSKPIKPVSVFDA